jgi:hypothetical protein
MQNKSSQHILSSLSDFYLDGAHGAESHPTNIRGDSLRDDCPVVDDEVFVETIDDDVDNDDDDDDEITTNTETGSATGTGTGIVDEKVESTMDHNVVDTAMDIGNENSNNIHSHNIIDDVINLDEQEDDPTLNLSKNALRKAAKKLKKQQRRAQREGRGDPTAGQKKCEMCGKSVDLLIRCIYEESQQWRMVCGKCWNVASGGVVDGDAAHPYYRYGGLWKNRRK